MNATHGAELTMQYPDVVRAKVFQFRAAQDR